MSALRYEIRITERIGPLFRAVLDGLDARDDEERALVIGNCGDIAILLRLLRRLHAVGLNVDQIRIDRVADHSPPTDGVLGVESRTEPATLYYPRGMRRSL
jgi:hypothetical protein